MSEAVDIAGLRLATGEIDPAQYDTIISKVRNRAGSTNPAIRTASVRFAKGEITAEQYDLFTSLISESEVSSSGSSPPEATVITGTTFSCPDCGKQVSQLAASCPHCGRADPKLSKREIEELEKKKAKDEKNKKSGDAWEQFAGCAGVFYFGNLVLAVIALGKTGLWALIFGPLVWLMP